MSLLPILYVEGKDDIGVISALLARHGMDTKQGNAHLKIKDLESVDSVLQAMPDAIKSNTDRPVGFVIDIDIAVSDRWRAVCGQLDKLTSDAAYQLSEPRPDQCPAEGYIGKVRDYSHPFGIWLMPDCATDSGKLENLIATLVPEGDALWAHAQNATQKAKQLADAQQSSRFTDSDQIKADIHTWLAWKPEPGSPLGTAIRNKVLGHDSSQTLNFLRWLKRLYDFTQIQV